MRKRNLVALYGKHFFHFQLPLCSQLPVLAFPPPSKGVRPLTQKSIIYYQRCVVNNLLQVPAPAPRDSFSLVRARARERIDYQLRQSQILNLICQNLFQIKFRNWRSCRLPEIICITRPHHNRRQLGTSICIFVRVFVRLPSPSTYVQCS